MPGWPTCTCLYRKFSSRLGGISAKSSEISPKLAGSLLIWIHVYFHKSFLRKVRSHLGNLARLTGSAPPYEQLLSTFLPSTEIVENYHYHENYHVEGSFYKKVFWKYAANLQENTHAEVTFQWSCFEALLRWHFGMGFLIFLSTHLEGCFWKCLSALF